MTKPQQKYFVLALLILLAVAGIIVVDYLYNYPLLSPASMFLSLFIIAVSTIIYRLLQYYYFKTVVLAKSHNWGILIVMIFFAIEPLWNRSPYLLFGFPKYIMNSILPILMGLAFFFKFIPKYSSKQGAE